MSTKPSAKTGLIGAGAFITTIIVWVASLNGLEIPDGVGAAITGLVGLVIAYFVPAKSGKYVDADSRSRRLRPEALTSDATWPRPHLTVGSGLLVVGMRLRCVLTISRRPAATLGSRCTIGHHPRSHAAPWSRPVILSHLMFAGFQNE